MKKLLFIFLVLNYFLINAQYRIIPLDTNHYWQHNNYQGQATNQHNCNYTLKVIKDTVINGKTYNYVNQTYKYCVQPSFSTNFYTTKAFLRQDTILKRINFIDINTNLEYILYNFNKNTGDTTNLYYNNGLSTFTVQTKDSLLLNDGLYHKRLTYNLSTNHSVIEGVGGYWGLLMPNFRVDPFIANNYLICLGAKYPTQQTIYPNGFNCTYILGVKENRVDKKYISLSPNPSTDKITIKTENLNHTAIEVKNVLGQSVVNLKNINNELTEINIQDLPHGMYFVTIYFENKTATTHFIKN